MKKLLLICLTFFALMLSAELSWAANTYDWIGGVAGHTTDWAWPQNWKIGSTVQTANYPGSSASTDIVQIGVVTGTITNFPVVGATPANSIASITIGVTGGTSPSLTVNSPAVLTVTGDITYTTASTFTATLAGTGTISAANLNITTTSTVTTGSGDVSTLTSSITTLTLSGNLALTTSYVSSGHKTHDITFNFTGSTLSLAGIKTTNADVTNTSTVTTGANTTLNFTGGTAAELATLGTGVNTITFGSGLNVGYTGSVAQTVYTNAAIANSSLSSGISYTNITFSGSGIKTALAGNLNVTGSFTNSMVSDATTNYVDFSSPSVNFTGTSQALAGGTGVGTTFYTLTMSGVGTKTMSGLFNLASTGTLTMTGANTTILNAGSSVLTLKSNATSSATIAALSGPVINGNVIWQRFVTGNSSLTYRGYRLLSSAVNAAAGVYNLDFLKASGSWTSGASGGGFDVTGNPSMYLYRDDETPNNTSFTAGNWRGITKINASPTYSITTIDPLTINMPVGTGFLYFFRGNNSTSTTTPPSNITFSATGALNQGQITYKYWPTGTSGLDYSTVSGTSAVEGFNLVGNPYASSIDWHTNYGNASSTTGIYSTNLSNSIYIYDPVNKVYAAYLNTSATTGTATGNGSNIIPAGQGFFVNATTTGGSLIFNESAKISSQPGTLLLNAVTPPVDRHLRMELVKDSVNREETVLVFNNAASTAYVVGEDALYLKGNGGVNLCNIASNNQALAISQLPFPAKPQTIPLNVSVISGGPYQLNLKEITNIPSMFNVWLKDALLKDSVDIKNNPAYSFTVAGDTTGTGNRFSLVVSENPLQLLSFTGTRETGDVKLVWTAKNEDNFTQYTLQRSTDASKTFIALDSLTSANLGSYTDLDPHPIKGQNQYRLKQVDINGAVSYSSVVTVMYSPASNNVAANLVSVFPNPARTMLNLVIMADATASSATSYKITITSSAGIVIKTGTSTNPSWQDDVSSLIAGTYFVQVTNTKDNTIIGRSTFIKL